MLAIGAVSHESAVNYDRRAVVTLQYSSFSTYWVENDANARRWFCLSNTTRCTTLSQFYMLFTFLITIITAPYRAICDGDLVLCLIICATCRSLVKCLLRTQRLFRLSASSSLLSRNRTWHERHCVTASWRRCHRWVVCSPLVCFPIE